MGKETPKKLTPAEKKEKVWNQMSLSGRITVMHSEQEIAEVAIGVLDRSVDTLAGEIKDIKKAVTLLKNKITDMLKSK